MEMLQGVWKQHLRPRAVVGYGVKIFPPSPPNYVTRSPGRAGLAQCRRIAESARLPLMCPGFYSRSRHHMWVEFVGSLPCLDKIFSGYSGYFPLANF